MNRIFSYSSGVSLPSNSFMVMPYTYKFFENGIGGENPSKRTQTNLSSLKWLKSAEAAEYLRIPVETLRNYVYRGQLARYKPHGRLLFKRSDLDALIESSKKGGSYAR